MSTFEGIISVGLGLIVILLGFIALRMGRPTSAHDLNLTAELNQAIDQFGRAAQHHVDVSAVVELVRQIVNDPSVLDQLKTYPETVRAAAWLHYINMLGADLQFLQKYLSDQQRRYPSDAAGYVGNAQRAVDTVRAKLDAAIKLSGQSSLRSV